MKERYVIDDRCGCAAILDTEHEVFQDRQDGIHNGLHSDDGDVVLYVDHENLSDHEGYPVRYFEAMSKLYAEMHRLATGDILPKEIVAMEKQPEYEYLPIKFDHLWEAVKHYELDGELYLKIGDGFMNINDSCVVWQMVLADNYKALYQCIELTPERKREKEVEELGRELLITYEHCNGTWQDKFEAVARRSFEWMEQKG